MKILSQCLKFFRDNRLLGIALAAFVLCQGADFATSLWLDPRFEESNVYMRGAEGQFIPLRGIGVKAIATAFITLMAACLYWGLKPIDQRLAQIAAATPFFYLAFDTLGNAVIHNLLLRIGWYAP